MGEYNPPNKANSFTSVPPELLELLTSHLPTSLTLLRRLQFAAFKNFITPDARIVFSSDTGKIDESPHFAVAYADFSTRPDTQMIMYSSLEHATESSDPTHEEHIVNIVQELVRLRREHYGELEHERSLVLGSLHSEVYKVLAKTGRITPRLTGAYDKWLFKRGDVPEPGEAPEGMYWGTASLEDCRLVTSRTDIPRPPESLVKLPGLMLKLKDGTPISWAFIGPPRRLFDKPTLRSLFNIANRDGYRRRGIAKMLAAKLLRQATSDHLDGNFSGPEWSSADVAPDNAGSQGMWTALAKDEMHASALQRSCFFSSIVTLLSTAVGASAAPATPNQLVARTPPDTGFNNGFFYSSWADYNNANYPDGAGGSYSLSWQDERNVVAGKGWNPGSARYAYPKSFNITLPSYPAPVNPPIALATLPFTRKEHIVLVQAVLLTHALHHPPRAISFSGDYRPNGNSYLPIHGRTETPLIEYYIVEHFGTCNPASRATRKGQITPDGSIYDIYVSTRTNAPSTPEQPPCSNTGLFDAPSARAEPSQQQDHFNAWESLGLNMGSFDYLIVATEE
ncbi:hypothetical protein QQS21_008862 [Conoideocrella luteorostrata]|uniref:endo-1,4-beta-xylanase n=1 Tax=Conoideocrella luteorostrata TaxID=1105319 RepID=A0AAJ0FYB7_9HYPO|nr:hypothetical protein QQS21_008862 [Conoideocrella luteorostrata]